MMELGSKAFEKADQAFVAAVRQGAAEAGLIAPVRDANGCRAEPSRAEPSRAEGCEMRTEGSSPAVSGPETHVLREVRAISLAGVDVVIADTPVPVFEHVDPACLLVDDGYQRNLSERSMKLIRKICSGWDWRRFKPPVVARTERGLEVIDGQHTAIAAASHPGVTTIPIMIVTAAGRAERAQSFIGHNRDRLNITPMQMHYAASAAGDEEAQTIDQVCARAGVRMLKSTPGNGVFKVGDTVAVRGIGALINRRGAMRAREVLDILVAGRCAPISTGQLKAVEHLLNEEEYREDIDGPGITNALLALGEDAQREADVFAATHKVPVWKALAVVLFRKGKRRARRRTD